MAGRYYHGNHHYFVIKILNSQVVKCIILLEINLISQNLNIKTLIFSDIKTKIQGDIVHCDPKNVPLTKIMFLI